MRGLLPDPGDDHRRFDLQDWIILISVIASAAVPFLVVVLVPKPVAIGHDLRMPPEPILFIGSSAIARLPLEAHFPGKPAVNLGLGNETALDLRERLAEVLPAAAPAGIVLYAGSADLRFDQRLPAVEIRKRVEGVLDLLGGRYPKAPILLLEILPARQQSGAEAAALAALNAELADLARTRALAFVRTNRPPLVTEQGLLVESLTTDRFHLNDAGYEHLARWIVEDGGPVGALLR